MAATDCAGQTSKSLSQIIAKNVYEMRKNLGYSQKKLAEISGVDCKTIKRLEAGKGKTGPSVITLHWVATALGCTTDNLLIDHSGDTNPVVSTPLPTTKSIDAKLDDLTSMVNEILNRLSK